MNSTSPVTIPEVFAKANFVHFPAQFRFLATFSHFSSTSGRYALGDKLQQHVAATRTSQRQIYGAQLVPSIFSSYFFFSRLSSRPFPPLVCRLFPRPFFSSFCSTSFTADHIHQRLIYALKRFDICNYRKISKISTGAYIFQRPFLRGLFLEGLIYGRKFAFQNRLD